MVIPETRHADYSDNKILINYPPQERPPISVHLKCGLIGQVASIEGDNVLVFTISVHLKSELIRWVASLERDN
jgi:hypothetical protein